MQDFVKEYIEKKEAEFAAVTETASAHRTAANENERAERLIRLGMCRREYNPNATYSSDYPEEEHKTGRYFRTVPYEVSDEEYALICRYDDSPLNTEKKKISARFFARATARVRRLAAIRFFLGFFLSLGAGVFLYLIESQLLVGALLFVLVGTALSAVEASLYYAVGKNLKNTEYIMAQLEKKELLADQNGKENV